MAGDVAMVRKVVQLRVRSDTGFEQDALAERVGPRYLPQPRGMHLTGPVAVSWRPGGDGAITRILTGEPLVPEDVELVLGCGLIREAQVGVARPVREIERIQRPIRLVVHAPDAGVLVVPDVLVRAVERLLSPGPPNRKEPQAVALDWTAERD